MKSQAITARAAGLVFRLGRRALPVLLGPLFMLGCAAGGPAADFNIAGEASLQSERPFLLSRHNKLSDYTVSGDREAPAHGLFVNPARIGQSWYLMLENVLEGDSGTGSADRLNRVLSLMVQTDAASFSIQPSEYRFLTSEAVRGDLSHETATFQLTEQQLSQLAESRNLQLTVVGASKQVTLRDEQIHPRFQPNLRRFLAAGRGDSAERVARR